MKAPKRRGDGTNRCRRPHCGGIGRKPKEDHPAGHPAGPIWRFAFGKWSRVVAEDDPPRRSAGK